MGRYSIKELEKLSGIKAHTIRIWEKRHQLVDPQRTNTNIRFYSDDDLKKLINVSLLNANGVKISKIADMSAEEINSRVMALSESNPESAIHVDQLVIAMVELDEDKFEKILSSLVLRYGFEDTVVNIIYPFLEKIGVLWQTQHVSPAQEHFISNLIRQKVIVGIDSLPLPPKNAPRAMLFLPEHELHEIALLFSHYRLRKAGMRTFYLGQSVPLEDLKSTYDVHQPHIMLTFITSSVSRLFLENYIQKLATTFPACKLLISGAQLHSYQPKHENVFILKHLRDLNDHIDQ